jgi:hypothetical protein
MFDHAIEPAERPDDDDHDLLTYGEAGARLLENIAEGRRHLDELRGRAGSGDHEQQRAREAEIAAVAARVASLEEAKERLDRNRIDDSTFFGPGGRRRG